MENGAPKKETSPLARIAAGNRAIIIYGAGNLGSSLFDQILRYGIPAGQVRAFFDSDKAKNGTTLRGLPVTIPDDRYLAENPIVILAQDRSGQLALMRQAAVRLGYETISYAEALGRPNSQAGSSPPRKCFAIYGPASGGRPFSLRRSRGFLQSELP